MSTLWLAALLILTESVYLPWSVLRGKAACTLWLIARMFRFIPYSMTSAIRVDELVMMEEIRLFREGKYSIGYLWAPYWGHRMLIPRLLMIADERLFHFSNTPLAVASLLAQSLTTALLVWAQSFSGRDVAFPTQKSTLN